MFFNAKLFRTYGLKFKGHAAAADLFGFLSTAVSCCTQWKPAFEPCTCKEGQLGRLPETLRSKQLETKIPVRMRQNLPLLSDCLCVNCITVQFEICS